MAIQNNYSAEWTEDENTKEIRVKINGDPVVIKKDKKTKKGFHVDVTDYEIVPELVFDGKKLLPDQVPEDTVIFTHSQTCTYIPNPPYGFIKV